LFFKEICQTEIKYKKERPFAYYNCAQSHKKHFFVSDGYVFNSHERLQTNDCLLRLKHEYQYVTNYDVDEIIFPRKKKFNRETSLKCSLNESSMDIKPDQVQLYNIYDYTVGLDGLYSSYIVKKLHFMSEKLKAIVNLFFNL
jgi:hypothetical protein